MIILDYPMFTVNKVNISSRSERRMLGCVRLERVEVKLGHLERRQVERWHFIEVESHGHGVERVSRTPGRPVLGQSVAQVAVLVTTEVQLTLAVVQLALAVI